MALKTFLLTPDLTLPPDGPIRIGKIIAHPLRPTKAIFTPKNKPTTTTHVDFNNLHTIAKDLALHSTLLAQFLQSAGASFSGGADKRVVTQYTMDSLETIRLREDPTDAEAEELVREPNVRAAIKSGIHRNAPVYMITGMKVAKGFRISSRAAASLDVSAGATAPVAHGVGVSTEVGFARGSDTEDAWTSGGDIVLAYQLHVIKRKTFSRDAHVDVYAPSAAFLHRDEDEDVDEEDLEGFTVMLVSEEDREEIGEGEQVWLN